jgi:hypothetical protein
MIQTLGGVVVSWLVKCWCMAFLLCGCIYYDWLVILRCKYTLTYILVIYYIVSLRLFSTIRTVFCCQEKKHKTNENKH